MGSPTLSMEERDGVAIIRMNDQDETVNTLKRSLVGEIDSMLSGLENRSDIDVVVFTSSKPDSFIVGANLSMLREVRSSREARDLSTLLQAMHDRIDQLRPVTVVAIHGACLGGGLELALAFGYRIASDDPATKLGLPEVQLGLLPGGGGTQRLPRLVGVEMAISMMLTGKQINGKSAKRAGLVDEIVDPAILVEAAIELGRSRLSGKETRSRWSVRRIKNWLLSGNPVGRAFLFDRARKRTLKKTKGNYPAPGKILSVVRCGLEKGFEHGLTAEAESFGELVMSPQAVQLINLFFATTELKKASGVTDPSIEPRTINKIGVLGAGLMGAGIAYVSIFHGKKRVRLKDRDNNGLGHGLAYIGNLLRNREERNRITSLQRRQLLARITGTTDYSGFGNCELVIEAVFEDLELKRKMIKDIEGTADSGAIFATNTSAIPIKDIAAASQWPERVIGMHYFSPVERMPLLEIVVTPHTADWVTATCMAVGKAQGKTVIVVNDGPGFYTTRILGPYMSEAAHLLSEGVPIERIDKTMEVFGFPMGPLALLDQVGIDVAYKVGDTLHQAYGSRMSPVESMKMLVDDQRLGRKNKKGIYDYNRAGRVKPVDASVYDLLDVEPQNMMSEQTIMERCALRMINEAAHCLGEGILSSPRDGDVGAIFGLGFPPFLGGPFRYLDAEGCGIIHNRLEHLSDVYGERFQPAPVIQETQKFYN